MEVKGFVFSLDALFAIAIALIMITSSSYYLSGINENENQDYQIKQLTADFITVLEKNNSLENAIINNNSTELATFVNTIPQDICLNIELYHKNDLITPIIVVHKQNCESNYDALFSIKRSFVVENQDMNIFLAEVTSWRNEQ